MKKERANVSTRITKKRKERDKPIWVNARPSILCASNTAPYLNTSNYFLFVSSPLFLGYTK